MAQRPQPSLRLADGGSFITRWAQSVMRPNATPDNPAGIRFQDGGHVPGTGRGDKIPAKYEPGEFVVSNDMIDDNPGLREQLSGLRAETLAARGKTVEEADAKALNGGRRPSLRAVEGFPGIDVDERPWRGSADSRLFARDPGPGNPNVGRTPPAMPAAPAAAPPAAAPPAAAPVAAPAQTSTLRKAASAVGNGLLYGGAGVGGALAAKGLSDVGAPKGTAAVPGERQSGDSATSTQIPTGHGGAEPTPGAQPYNFWTDSEAGRNIGNAVNAIAPLGGLAMAARVPGAASKAFGIADAALGGLSAGVHNERAPANTATSAATTLRTRPEDTLAGPPESARSPVGDKVVFGGGQNDVRRVDRPGQSPLFTNVADDAPYIGNNALMARGNGPSAQNMAAADNLAASNDITPRLRAQAQYDAEVANAQRINSMQQRMNGAGSRSAQLDLRSPENLAARNASVSSNLDYNRMSRSEIQARTSLAGIEAQKQTAQMQNQTTLRGQDINAETSRYGADASTDASRYGSDNSLRGQMYSSDAQLGAKQMEMQRGLRQQQAMGELWKASGGDPAKFQSLAMQYGLPDAAKQGGDMVAARQTQAKANSEDAQSTFKGMFLDKEGKPDAGGEAMAHHAASQIVPGWENMSQEQRNAARPRVVEYVNMLQQANNNRDTGWLQKAGITKSSDMRSQMPDMAGATLSDVGWWEGATTPNIGQGDKKVTLKNGAEMHFDSLNEAQKRLLEINGVRQQK